MSSLEQDPLWRLGILRVWGSFGDVGAFQLSLLSFLYSPFA